MSAADDSQAAAGRPRAGLIGTFDLANFGDLLLPAITERELTRRIPDLVLRRYSPYGWEHPVPMDGGEVAEPLGAPSRERRREVASACDALVIGGGEIAHFFDHLLAPHYDTTPDQVVARAPSTWFIDGVGDVGATPTVWNAVGIPFDFDVERSVFVRDAVTRHRYVAVRDDESRKRLEQVGVDREIAVVPDPGFVVTRLFDFEVVERRRRLHAALGWLPPERYIVVQGNGSMINEVDRTSMAIEAVLVDRPEIGIVAIETGLGHGDADFASAFTARHPGRVWSPSAPLLPVDIVAILANAEAFVGVSMHGAITTLAHGRRAVIFNAPRQSKLRGLVAHLHGKAGYVESPDDIPAALRWALTELGPDPTLAEVTRQVDAHFDEIAAVIESVVPVDGPKFGPPGPRRVRRLSDELVAVRVAHAVRGQRLLAERDSLTGLLDERDERIAVLEEQLTSSVAQIAALEGQLAASDARVAAVVAELESAAVALRAVQDSRTMRWLRWPHRIYGRLHP